ncbi:MAG: glycosyltransferase [Halodesulfurarchaeum sp.]
MRVAFVSAETVHHTDTGATDRLARVASGLAARGHELTHVTAAWWEGDFQDFESGGITYRGIDPGPVPTLGVPSAVGRAIAKIEPDIVHADCGSSTWLMGAWLGAKLAGAGLLLDCDGPAPKSWPARRILSRADSLLVPSELVRTRIREQGIDGGRVEVVPTGIDVDRIADTEPAAGGDIVYSRRLDENANLETLLLALAEFRRHGWEATIIGDGPKRSAYERQARDLRIEDRVQFVGSLPVEERLRYFVNAHVYVHTAEETPFAHDLLRALAAGAVAIVEYHEDSSAHELVETEKRGFTATSPAELTRRLGTAGELERRCLVEEFDRFDDEAILERYLDIYRSIRG